MSMFVLYYLQGDYPRNEFHPPLAGFFYLSTGEVHLSVFIHSASQLMSYGLRGRHDLRAA